MSTAAYLTAALIAYAAVLALAGLILSRIVGGQDD